MISATQPFVAESIRQAVGAEEEAPLSVATTIGRTLSRTEEV